MGTGYEKLAEGYYTEKALKNFGKKYGVELPICESAYDILYEDKDVKDTFKSLFQTSLKEEF